MGKTFTLTTPLSGGPKHKADSDAIKAFQRLFKSHGYYTGAIDGIYGKSTAASAYQAKFWLGYKIPDHSAGDMLYGYLSGKTKPTAEMKALTAKRKAAANKLTPQQELGKKVLAWYIKHNGEKEHPAGSNHSFVTDWYGSVGPWCAMTGCMAYAQSGSKVWTKATSYKHNWAYVPNIEHDARLGINGLRLTHNPFAGNGICFDWPGETPGLSDHFGVFEKWISKKAGTFYSREGNTAVGNNSNGGQMMQRERNLSEVRAFVVVTG